MTDKKYEFDKRPMDTAETDGTKKTADYVRDAAENAAKKAEAVSTTPATAPAGDEVDVSPPDCKTVDKYENYADNDGNFHLRPLNDGTNVEEGVIMENQAREPAHQQHELAVEEDAPGFEQAAALMTPRGSEHYNEGGSNAEVDAGRSFGEA